MSEPARGLVVVVEDEPSIAELLRLYLAREGFGVHVEVDGQAGYDAIVKNRPVAAVLDVGLPSLTGTEICRQLRAADDWTPVLFCTARDDEIDRVIGLEMGADDYITKPFSPREVVARVKAVVRRAAGQTGQSDVLRLADIEVDRGSRRATVGGQDLSLTPTEFDLLAHLVARPGRVFSREQLLSEVWGYSSVVSSRTVDVHVAQLRAKLGDSEIIRTVRGIGYSVEAPGRDDASSPE